MSPIDPRSIGDPSPRVTFTTRHASAPKCAGVAQSARQLQPTADTHFCSRLAGAHAFLRHDDAAEWCHYLQSYIGVSGTRGFGCISQGDALPTCVAGHSSPGRPWPR